jgi:type IV pilus assembly protein PilO
MSMMSLKVQIRWCVRAQLSLGGLFLLAVTAFYLFGYRPITNRLRTLESETVAMQQELRENSAKSQILPAVALEVKNMRLKLEGAKKMPKDMDVAGFITDLTRISQLSQLSKPQYHPDAPKRGDLFWLYPITLQLQGNFSNVFNFIRETESLPRLSRVRSISIKADQKQPGVVTVNLGMDLYYSPDM